MKPRESRAWRGDTPAYSFAQAPVEVCDFKRLKAEWEGDSNGWITPYSLPDRSVNLMPRLSPYAKNSLDAFPLLSAHGRAMNPYELKKQWGDRMTFWGGLGSQSTIPRGTPEDIRAEIRRLRREMSKGGGYILAPAKPLQPETPIENAVAIVKALTEDQNRNG